MTLLQDIVKLIPRGSLIEGSSKRAFAAGYGDDADMQFITRKKGKKIERNIIVKEALKFASTGDSDFNANGIDVVVMSNHPDDGYFDDYYGISVLFHLSGVITCYTHGDDKKAEVELDGNKPAIIKAAKKALHLGEKHAFLKFILEHYKEGDGHYAEALITLSRKHGFDYPEFAAIEKSIKAAKKDRADLLGYGHSTTEHDE